MKETLLADTGPLLCLLAEGSEHEAWAAEVVHEYDAPALTTEPVLTEAAHLLRRFGRPPHAILKLIQRGMLRVGLSVEIEHRRLIALMEQYHDVPMSLADASLVRLSELHRECRVWTLDSDFHIYRRNGNKPIPLLMPDE